MYEKGGEHIYVADLQQSQQKLDPIVIMSSATCLLASPFIPSAFIPPLIFGKGVEVGGQRGLILAKHRPVLVLLQRQATPIITSVFTMNYLTRTIGRICRLWEHMGAGINKDEFRSILTSIVLTDNKIA